MSKARHAFGASANVASALEKNLIDSYDILFLDGDTEPKIGWVDASGVVRIVDTASSTIVEGDALPEVGETGQIYIFNEEAYVYNGAEYVSISKSADLTALEEAIATKVDESKVQEMIEAYADADVEVVEF